MSIFRNQGVHVLLKMLVIVCFVIVTMISIIEQKTNYKDSTVVKYLQNVPFFPKVNLPIPVCPMMPPNLVQKLDVNLTISLAEAEASLKDGVDMGGTSRPSECIARYKVAIIIPYRDRQDQIGPFLNHLHKLLQLQQLNYSIFLVEQTDEHLFNRAALLNIGFLQALKERDFDCVIFHDVDLFSEYGPHLYHCAQMPRLLNVADSKHNYVPYGEWYFGGVSSMSVQQMKEVNGYSNEYWGWGGEDDDMKLRLQAKGYVVWSYPASKARYKMMEHKQTPLNKRSQKENIQEIETN